MVDTVLPARTEWLGDFAKLRPSDFGVMAAPPVAAAGAEGAGTSQQQTQEAIVELSLDMRALSRWEPTVGGATATSFTAGRYTVRKGVYTLRLTDSTASASLTVV